jgi:hypothetical protein
VAVETLPVDFDDVDDLLDSRSENGDEALAAADRVPGYVDEEVVVSGPPPGDDPPDYGGLDVSYYEVAVETCGADVEHAAQTRVDPLAEAVRCLEEEEGTAEDETAVMMAQEDQAGLDQVDVTHDATIIGGCQSEEIIPTAGTGTKHLPVF